jgi:hypothetical protein
MTLESALKKTCKQYLSIKGWMTIHNLAGMGCYPGLADMTAIKEGRVLWIEYKSPGGPVRQKTIPGVKAKYQARGKQSEYQKKFQADIEAHGGEYLLVYSVEDLIKAGI